MYLLAALARWRAFYKALSSEKKEYTNNIYTPFFPTFPFCASLAIPPPLILQGKPMPPGMINALLRVPKDATICTCEDFIECFQRESLSR